MPKIDLNANQATNATGYPPEYAAAVAGRYYQRLGPANGLTDFAVSHVVLEPGAWSAQRHWHEDEDEFAVILSGVAILVDDEGRHTLNSGDCAAFPKNDGNGHCLINEGTEDCVFIVVGQTKNGNCHYPDIDMRYNTANNSYTRKDGSPY